MLIDRIRLPLPKQPDASVFRLAAPSFASPRAAKEALTITWVGHSTTLIQLDGLNILTDPVWSEFASPVSFAGPRRWVPPGISFDSLPPIDIVVMSHNHYDHCDAATIRRLASRYPHVTWLAPLGVSTVLRKFGALKVIERDWWESVRVSDIDFSCAPAQHFSARGLLDRDKTLWCSWAMRSPSSAVYFGGDSGLHPEFKQIAERFGPFDVVILPIGAYEPRWFMRPVHMNPVDALEAYQQLHSNGPAPVFLPIHWGTFKLTDEPMDEPPVKLRAGWNAAGYALDALWIAAHGETRAVTRS